MQCHAFELYWVDCDYDCDCNTVGCTIFVRPTANSICSDSRQTILSPTVEKCFVCLFYDLFQSLNYMIT